MRLLHPKTLEMIAREEIVFPKGYSKKTVISHAWSEVFKFKSSKRSHPKMFIENDFDLVQYLSTVYIYGKEVGCSLDASLVEQHFGMDLLNEVFGLELYFDDDYFFSDLVSLYIKGIDLFQFAFTNNRKYVPIENHEEMLRLLMKYLGKEKSKKILLQQFGDD